MMKALLISTLIASSPSLSAATPVLGLDARDRLIEVCSDEIHRFETNSIPVEVNNFWNNTPVPENLGTLDLDAVATRAAFGVTILDTYAIKVILSEAEKQSELLDLAFDNAENSKSLVECAIAKLGDNNITTTSLFLAWLDCHKPFHNELKMAHDIVRLNGAEYTKIADETLGVNTPCRKVVQ